MLFWFVTKLNGLYMNSLQVMRQNRLYHVNLLGMLIPDFSPYRFIKTGSQICHAPFFRYGSSGTYNFVTGDLLQYKFIYFIKVF